MSNAYATDKDDPNITGCWPCPGERLNEIIWRLRNAPGQLTREDQLVAASVLSAFDEFVALPERKRNMLCNSLRRVAAKRKAVMP